MITVAKPRPVSKLPSDFLTHSGATLNLVSPSPSAIRIEDIALALSRICRSNGHLDEHYSVAEHSVRVAERLKPLGDRMALLGLLHDAAEAYMGDCPTPLKHLLGQKWRVIEDRIQWAIHDYAGLGIAGCREKNIVSGADHDEMDAELDEPYGDPMDAETARWEFLREYRQLQSRLRRAR